MALENPSAITPGTVVRHVARPATVGAVVSVDDSGGETRYGVFHDGRVHTYFASQIEPVEDNTAVVKATATELQAGLTATLLLDENSDYLHTRNAGRVDFEPYQYRPVLKLVQAERPRILIADDVGVGKTIEACLILKELQARKRAESVLVICPKPLVVDDKWRNELKRFDEDFAHLDSKTLRYCLEETAREGFWPARYRKAILPYSLLDEALLTGRRQGRNRQVASLDQLVGELQFDLVIIDEAHHIRNPETKAYQCVQRFVDASEAVVMLSATPIQTGSTDLFTLVNLLRDDLVLDDADFTAMLEPNEHLYLASEEARRATADWQERAATHLRAALATTWGREVMSLDPSVAELGDLLDHECSQDRDRVRSVRLIESLNTFSEVVTRTRRRDIGEFTTRRPSAPEVMFTDDQQQVYDATIALGARIAAARAPGMPLKFLLSTLLRQAASSITGLAPLIEDLFANRLRTAEMSGEDEELTLTSGQLDAFRDEAKALAAQAERLIGSPDPKVDQLRRIVEDKAADDNNKVLVFSTFRHTIAYLDEQCRGWGARVAVMHGGVPDDQRKEIRSRFQLDRSDPKAYDVLLCSEVGTEGLDYQFCNTMVNYDIPWNPMRIEQRIGRIDRRGQQSETVAIINLLTKGTIEAEIYERCLSRIGVFNHALGGSEKILGEVTEAIVDIATNLEMSETDRAAALRQLADNKLGRIEEEQRLEDQQSELFGYVGNAFEENLAEASSEWLTSEKIAELVRRYFDQIQPGRAIALRPGRVATVPLNAEAAAQILDDLNAARLDAVRLKRRLRGDKVVLSLTTDPELAKESDQIELLGPTHPLVTVAADHSQLNGPREASLRVTSGDVPPGQYAVGVYSWTRLGVRDALTLRFVADDALVEEHAAALVSEASSADASSAPAGPQLKQEDRELLDRRHTDLWNDARTKHRRRHEESVERRIAALSAQRTRRVTAAQRRLDAATHPDIAVMRHGELISAQTSFDRLIANQQAARDRADIKATHIATVSLEVVAP